MLIVVHQSHSRTRQRLRFIEGCHCRTISLGVGWLVMPVYVGAEVGRARAIEGAWLVNNFLNFLVVRVSRQVFINLVFFRLHVCGVDSDGFLWLNRRLGLASVAGFIIFLVVNRRRECFVLDRHF